MKTNRPLPALLILYFLLGAGLAQASGTWRLIATDKGRSIEVDTASIQREADGKVRATARMVLDKEILDLRSGEPYKSIQTTTLFDCKRRTAQTLKRSFIRQNEEVLREEEVRASSAMPVRSGTLDDRTLRELCRPPGIRGEAMRLADKAGAAAAALHAANEAMLQRQANSPANSPARGAAGRSGRVPAPKKPAPSRRTGASAASAKSLPPPPATWAYEGPGGPEHWAEVRADSMSCREGRRQSPIDIRDGIVVDLEPVHFEYQPSLFVIQDNGHGIEVQVGGNRLSLLGKYYELQNLHFHHPAEEKIEGRGFDMGAHLVHRADDGELLVVAVLFEQGEAHPLIQTLWNYLPLEKHLKVAPPDATIDLNRLLPEQRGYHTYMGSLTTPPCTEGVIWVVLQQPVQISAEQEAILARLYPANARPLQPGHGRLIKSSRPPPQPSGN